MSVYLHSLRRPLDAPVNVCAWCGGEPSRGKRRFCKGHYKRWFNFWYGTVPGYVIVVFARSKFKCCECGMEADLSTGWAGVRQQLHVDHIVPVSKGGSHLVSNMQTLCRRCNLSKGARLHPKPIRKQAAQMGLW